LKEVAAIVLEFSGSATVVRRHGFAHDLRVPVAATTHRLVWAIALTLVAVATPREGHARTVAVATRLEYSAAPGCPSGEGFQTIVTARLGYDVFRADAPDLVIVHIEPAGRTLEGRLDWRDANGASVGEQAFPSRTGDCAELARAMGFALALQIQLRAATIADSKPAAPTAPPMEAANAPPATKPSAAAPVESAGAAAVSEARSEAAGPSVAAGAGALAGVGLSSKPIAVGRLFATVAWTHAALELAGEVSAPSTTNRADGAGFSQQQFLASLATCGVLLPFSVCAVGKVGEVRMVGQGVDVPLTASGLMIQSGLRLAVAHSLGQRAYIMGQAEGLARLTQGTVTLDSIPVWTSPRFAALLGIGVAFRFR
jgi:hypothetical protein